MFFFQLTTRFEIKNKNLKSGLKSFSITINVDDYTKTIKHNISGK